MSRSTKIIIALAVISVLLLIAGFVIGNLSKNESGDTITNAVTNTNTSDGISGGGNTSDAGGDANDGSVTADININTSDGSDTNNSGDDGISALALAKLFAERYGSYSTDTNFANILDLTIFMSDSYAAIQKQYVEEQRLKGLGVDEPFYGITTRALSYDRLLEEDDVAEYRISTRRTERKSASDPETFNQDIIIELIMEDGSWKVNAATWQ